MADPKFADAVLSRFSGGSAAPAPEDDEDAPEVPNTDAEDGRMLASAVKRGDGAAICEAVRRIVGA